MTESVRKPGSEAVPEEDDLTAEAVLARFGGDPHAALVAALEDVVYLRDRLTVASLMMSYGFVRGWQSSLMRHRKPLADRNQQGRKVATQEEQRDC